MDVNLPNLSGDQITKLIREFPFKNIKTIPIIGLTADGYQENIDNCRKAGMNKVLIKPFDKEDFLKSIFKTLGSSNRD
jgi:CheY-like chemotaxis protein